MTKQEREIPTVGELILELRRRSSLGQGLVPFRAGNGLERERRADLIVVDGNSLDDVTVLLKPRRMETVLKGGAGCRRRDSWHPLGMAVRR